MKLSSMKIVGKEMLITVWVLQAHTSELARALTHPPSLFVINKGTVSNRISVFSLHYPFDLYTVIAFEFLPA
jgi:hypothetical protein